MNLKQIKPEHLYLGILSLFAIALRAARFEVFKIYSDSYKFLLIANATYHGTWISSYYPTFLPLQDTDLVSPYKWLFGIVVGLGSKTLTTSTLFVLTPQLLEQTAHWIIVLSGIGSLFLFYKIFQKLQVAVWLRLLLLTLFAFSGVHIIWSGFIITDTFAAMVILLCIYLLVSQRTIPNMVALVIMSGIMYITRVELGIAALALLGLTVIFSFISNKKFFRGELLQILLIFADLAFIVILLLNTFSGTLITAIFQADLLFWILLFGSSLWSIARHFLRLKTNMTPMQSSIVFTLKITASLMMMVYYVFNKDMGRYVLLVLPYFYVITAIEIETLVATVQKRVTHSKVIFYTATILCGLLFIQQLTYTQAFPKYQIPDYHTEVSTEVIAALTQNEKKICESDAKACDQHIKPILFVAQQDPYLWADFKNEFEIKFLSKENYDGIIQQALAARNGGATDTQLSPVNPSQFGQNRAYFLEDPSLQYKDAYFATNAAFTLLKEVKKTNAQFWVNDIREDGWYRVWYVSW